MYPAECIAMRLKVAIVVIKVRLFDLYDPASVQYVTQLTNNCETQKVDRHSEGA